MTQREKNLMTALVAVLGIGGSALAFHYGFYDPYKKNRAAIVKAKEANDQIRDQVDVIFAGKKQLDKARAWSLPANLEFAADEYRRMLQPLIEKSGLAIDTYQGPNISDFKQAAPAAPGKRHGHITLPFTVRAKGTMTSLVKLLYDLQNMPVMHRVRTLQVDRLDTTSITPSPRLNITLGIEAMIVSKSENRPANIAGYDDRLAMIDTISALVRAPARLASSSWALGPTGPVVQRQLAMAVDRNYADMGRKNMFVGLLPAPKKIVVDDEPPPGPLDGIDLLEFVKLDQTVPSDKKAFFRNYLQRGGSFVVKDVHRFGADLFKVMDEGKSKTYLRAKVLRIDQRDVYIQVMEDVYAVHIGQSFREAMRRPLSNEEMELLDLVSVFDQEWADEEMAINSVAPSTNKGKMQKKRSR